MEGEYCHCDYCRQDHVYPSKINVFELLLCADADMVTVFRATLVELFAHETKCSKQDE